jgi:ABC-type spermidine/putrescine transport system permease subunit I
MKALRRLKQVPGAAAGVIGIPFFWLFLFFLLPFIIVVKISFAEADVAIPPYTDVVSWADNQLTILLNLGNYLLLQEDELYIAAYLGSLKIALVSTLLCLLIGYPMAYAISRANKETQTVLLLLIMMPTWTSILIRVYAWMGILSNNGLLNSFLLGIGVIDEPLQILNTNLAVYIGIVYSYLPFMVLPLYANLVKHDQSLLEAAYDLGAQPGGVLARSPCRSPRTASSPAACWCSSRRWASSSSRDAGRPGDPDDRQGAVAGVLQQPRLAGGLRPGGGDAGGADHSDHPVQPQPGSASWKGKA